MFPGLLGLVAAMKSSWRSLRTKTIVVTLAIFVVGIWSLTFYASRNLRSDMVRLLGEQQFSTVSLVADRVNHELEDRVMALEEVAYQSAAAMQSGPEAMQAHLDRWKDLYSKFNGGTFVTNRERIAIAALPTTLGRVGTDYSDREYARVVFEEGRSVISDPLVGRVITSPLIVIAVPIKDASRRVIGMLAGVVDLKENSFLDQVTANQYGKTGGYVLVVPRLRLVATATDKSRVMEVLPPRGQIPLIDGFIDGGEGFGITQTPRGQESLVSAKQVPVSSWYVAAVLPTDEAFAPIRDMERRIFLATIFLTLLAGSLVWIFLKAQVAPLLLATEALQKLSDDPGLEHRLPIIRDDEIGDLVNGFNALLLSLGQRKSLLRQILDTSSVAIFLVDLEGRITLANRRMHEMFDWPDNSLIGRFYVDLIHPSERQSAHKSMLRLLTSEVISVDTDRLYWRQDHSQFWGHLNGRNLLDADNVRQGLVGVIADIDARKQSEQKLQLAASVFSHAREGITITAADGTIIDVNDAFSRITGYSRAEALGRNPRIIKSDHHEPEFYAAMWHDLVSKGYWSGEIWNRRKNGELYPELLTISAVRDDAGQMQHYVALFTDITPMKAHEEQLRQMAHFDLLTTLPNRALLADRLQQALSQSRRRGSRVAVACLDLDGFKAVNDTYGHKVGDDLLVALSGRMRQTLRDGDTLARLGGDEFVAVLSEISDDANCLPLLDRLLWAASVPVTIDDVELQVSASLGVTFYPQSEEVDADQLMRQADQAMYEAKLSGKNRYHIFDPELHRSVRDIHENLEDVRRGLGAHEFVLYYQPKVSMSRGTVIGAEALIRWAHPVRGLVPPALFLPAIENHPLAVAVGEWVVRTALTQIRQWQSAGVTLGVSVNVGARQLQQRDFAQRLRRILADFPDIPPGMLEIEILETSALEDMDGVCRIIAACQEFGVNFALDDFGTGYSSLSYLKRLSVNQIKIDQSFVRDMLDDPDDLTILEGMISLAGAFRKQVIAEGVETVAHGRLLLQLGCDLAQGYGIARPMPGPGMVDWITSWRPDADWQGVRPLGPGTLPLLFAFVEHRAWVTALADYLQGKGNRPEPDLARSRFANALSAVALQPSCPHAALADLTGDHEQIHALAVTLLEWHDQQRGDEARARIDELQALRERMSKHFDGLIQLLE